MPEVNTPVAADVIKASDESDIASLSADAMANCIGLAGDYLYAKMTKYDVPILTAWAAFKRMWAAMAASLALDGTYPASTDKDESNRLRKLVDDWLGGVNDNDAIKDDAGTALPLTLKTASGMPRCSTSGVEPLFPRATRDMVIGKDEADAIAKGLTEYEKGGK